MWPHLMHAVDGAMDGPAFFAYVEQVQAPTPRKRDIVFMDNVRTHEVALRPSLDRANSSSAQRCQS